MSLKERAKKDVERYSSNKDTGFADEIVLTAPDNTIVTLNGLHTKTYMGVNTDGVTVSSKKAHVSFSEKFLTDASYPVRNTAGDVDLKNHKVDVKDSTGVVKNYVVEEWFPDEEVGFIVCILEDRE